MLATAFSFLDATRLFTLVDHELELVEPEVRHIDDVLAACRHPLTQKLMPAHARAGRDTLMTFLEQNPRGQSQGDPARNIAPGYTFWMRSAQPIPTPIAYGRSSHARTFDVAMAGSISLRIGQSPNLDRYLGHIGYHVLPPARGHHFAERAARLLLPLARAHGQHTLWITCNPDNAASRRTCERLAASYVDIVEVPKDNALYSQGDREKCRYRLDL